MAQQNSHSPQNIPPALLKNFNYLEVLQPQICHQTKPLVDLADNDDVFGTSLPLIPSDKGFNEIDLYQDIFVNPQLVKPRQTNQTTENEVNIDFNEFFDKCEFGEKVDWINKHIEDAKHAETKNNAPPIIYAENSKLTLNNVVEDPEDLIEEVLASKVLERSTLSEVNMNTLGDIRVLAPPKLNKDILADPPRAPKAYESNTQSEDTVDNLQRISSSLKTLTLQSPTENEILNKASKSTISHQFNGIKSDMTQLRAKVLPAHSTISIYPLFANPATKSTSNVKDDLRELNSLKDFLDDVRRMSYNDKPVPNGKIDILKSPVTPRILSNYLPLQVMVKTKRFDREKPKNDCNKPDGPTYEEKAAVLPGVLMRLELRKQAIEEESNLKKRLILDAGTMKMPAIDFPAMPSPVVLTDNCNRDRLAAFETRKILKDLTMKGN